jgi:nucleotide-binding universal stress UspA family protein
MAVLEMTFGGAFGGTFASVRQDCGSPTLPLARIGRARTAMYERVLAAIDHSGITEHVLDAAGKLARLSHGEVWVLHVREHESLGLHVSQMETIDEAHRVADAAVDQLTRAGVKARADIRYALLGHAAREIVASADAHRAGVIVMGSHGRGDLAGLLLGSTAHKVIHLADRPVLVIR